MQEFTHTKRLFWGVLIVMGVLMVAYGYGVFEIFRINQETQVLEESVRVDAFREDIDRSTRSTLVAIEDSRSFLDSLFLEEDEIVAFIEHIESLASVTGATIDVRQIDVVEAEEKQDVYEWLELTVVTEGDWQEVYHTLSLFENLPVILVLDLVDLDVRQNEEDTVWSGRLDFRVAKKIAL